MSLPSTSNIQNDTNSNSNKTKNANKEDCTIPLYQCTQCQNDDPEIILNLLLCMHSICNNCLEKKHGNPCSCICGKSTDRSLLLNINRFRATFGKCHATNKCPNKGYLYCSQCRLNFCKTCSERHNLHHNFINVGIEFVSCSKHPMMAAKFLCSCESFLCHACSSGYNKEHKTHTKASRLNSAYIIDTMEQVHKATSELQKTTKGSFQHFTKEKDVMREHFKKMKLELAEKAVDIVNMIMRKMNDCLIAMEMFEKSYLDSYEKCEQDHKRKQHSMSLFKKISTLTADNFPSQDSIPFIREASVQLASDSSELGNRMNECIEMYRSAPTLLIDIKSITDSINANTRFLFKNQTVTPPIKTDPNKKTVIIDFDKIKAAIFNDSITLKKRYENSLDGPDAKKMKIDQNIFQQNILMQPPTTMTNMQKGVERPSYLIRPGMPPQQIMKNVTNAAINRVSHNLASMNPMMMDPRNFPTRMVHPQPPVSRNMSMQNHQIRPMRPNQNTVTVPIKNRPIAPLQSTSMQHPVMNPIRTPMAQPIVRMTPPQQKQQSPVTNGQQRQPIVCDLRAGNLELEKQLMDVLKGNSMRTNPSQIRPNMPPVIQPKQPEQNSSTATTPTLSNGSQPGLPPIKLTLKRNSLQRQTPSATTPTEKRPEKPEDWDDYCFVCNQGCDEISGDLVCCETCPKVYHNICHCPKIPCNVKNLPDDWKCTRCNNAEPITQITDTFTSRERIVCAKVLLKCYEKSEHVEAFHNPIPLNTKKYYEIIKQPMCLREIGGKISAYNYTNITQFIEDMNLVFKNCSTFNKKGTPVEESNKIIYGFYQQAIRTLLPAYSSKVWMYINLYRQQ